MHRKTHGYWTKERCQEEALKYKTRGEYAKGSKGSYLKAMRKKWLGDICTHMVELRKPNGYWTKERCQEEALKYKTRCEFQENCSSAYSYSNIGGWIDDVCSHMVETCKPKGYWTKERCQEEALKYKTRGEFRLKSPSCYTIVCKFGWLDDIAPHMPVTVKFKSKEDCRIVALKYNTKKEFREMEPACYQTILRNDWLDDVCSHMKNHYINWTYEMCKDVVDKYNTKKELRENDYACYQTIKRNGWSELLGNLNSDASLKDRYVYAYEFPKHNSVYVGLTWNLEVRNYRHMNESDSTVFQFISENNLCESDFNFVVLGYYDMRAAGNMETKHHDNYKNKGWSILNKVRTGGLGTSSSRLYWTKEKCIETAKNFNTRKEFQLAYKGAYKRCSMEGWLDDVCAHMTPLRYRWTFENCEKVAKTCSNRSDLRNKYPGAYNKSKTKGWLDVFFPKKSKKHLVVN